MCLHFFYKYTVNNVQKNLRSRQSWIKNSLDFSRGSTVFAARMTTGKPFT